MNSLIGHTVKDRITGFTGVVTGFCEYISGCNQALVTPQAGGGDYKEPHWFDVQRLENTGSQKIELDNSETPGFDKPAPIR